MTADKSQVWAYLEDLPLDDEVLLRARERAKALGSAAVPRSVGQLLSVLAAASKASTVVEIGVGAGVSGVYLLRGLSSNAVLTSIDPDVENLRAAKLAFSEAGYASNRTRTISGKPAAVLPRLSDSAYDVVFINDEVSAYPHHVEQGLRLLRSGGLLVVNDALDGARVADPAVREPDTVTARQVLKTVRENTALISSVLPVGHGLLLAVKE